MIDIPTSPQRLRHPLPPSPPPSTPSKPYRPATGNTPFRISSSLATSAPTPDSHPSYVDSSRQSTSAAPVPTTQLKMDRFIESELHNAIFHDPKFVERFLSGDVVKLDQVQKECKHRDTFYRNQGRWDIPSKAQIKLERALYDPVLEMLNTIKVAVDTVNPPAPTGPLPQNHEPAIESSSPLTSDGNPSSDNDPSSDYNPSDEHDPSSDHDPSGDYIPEQPQFINTSASAILSDREETKLIRPDLVLFDDDQVVHRHWERVRMPIEIKKKSGYQKAAMKQLSRYARAVFAHQLHRRHLYAMMVCGTEATFVRFDRAGILYSPPFDLNKESESQAFTDAFASLLMLDQTDQGYDPAFTCATNEHGRLDYYVDLPASTFSKQEPTSQSTTSGENKTRRFKVVDRLCHRRSICGRATIVLRIRSMEGGDEYILKIMWRDPERGLEGKVLRKVKGKFGLPQHVWDRDACGKCRCSPKATGPWECTRCVAETAQLDQLEICEKMTDVAIKVPLIEDEQGSIETEFEDVDTAVCLPTSQRRSHRICVFVVMSSKGRRLEFAESPRQFMETVLDAILGTQFPVGYRIPLIEYAQGYWGLYNLGILHRDISEGNVLMLLPQQQLNRNSDPAGTKITEKVLIESENALRKVLDQLKREPTGMLCDFDLYAEHSTAAQETTTDDPNLKLTIPKKDDGQVAPSPVSTSSRTSGFKRRSQESPTEETSGAKKFKTPSGSGVPVTSQPDAERNTACSQADPGERLIDFRTGTPAFMSIHVINVSVGKRYQHSFLDDIESFFWLVLWSAAAHLDDGIQCPTAVAQSTLNLFNQHDPTGIATFKRCQLADCSHFGGLTMRKNLDELGNSWASHRLFSEVIVNFGTLVYEYHYAVLQKKIPSPVNVFPKVVGVFQDALSHDSN